VLGPTRTRVPAARRPRLAGAATGQKSGVVAYCGHDLASIRLVTTPQDDSALTGGGADRLADAGFHQQSALGFEITRDLRSEYLADPTRMPTSLQTAERKAAFLSELAAARVGDRHGALLRLSGWDPDPEVAAALRPLLESDDVFEAGQAALGLARQADLTDLPAVMRLLHTVSPADGGTTEAMIAPLKAALALAALANPGIVEGVKVRAREWRGTAKVRRQSWETQLDAELDALLAPA
jgi:hypothetical protein